ncbi:SMC-Scp complex subunit ScpB [Bacillus sp. FJAT-44742]|uniref:SMC-Scp complex subunit ScpB n=1 Tax=Bacillus sp. FJAT-44742 TaxID=2014005 RepID=UPI000C23D22F|nr:SMC-Scp complex subunit ScpB [Bacillus sp. FJAT-44742]
MSNKDMLSVLEGLLFVCGDEGLAVPDAVKALDGDAGEVKEALLLLSSNYEYEERGLQIKEFGDRFYMMTRKEHAPYFKKLIDQSRKGSLSQASLETLAIIAYKQPITRVEIEEIRGVKSEKPMQTLISKGLVQEAGRAQSTGRAILYQTTQRFLDVFELSSLDELPPLPEGKEESEEEADLFFESFEDTIKE